MQKEHIEQLDQSIERIEKAVLKSARELPCYQRLNTLPGIGRILGLTITMEVGEIKRFKAQGNLASYCRTVDSKRMSNGKKKGDNNQKCGNKYLAWAFVEAANFAKRYDDQCRKWFDRKAAKTSNVIATKALAPWNRVGQGVPEKFGDYSTGLACKLAKAAWHVMAHAQTTIRSECFQSWRRARPNEFGRAAASQRKGLATKPCWTDWRRRFSDNLAEALKGIRPCRESKTGWTQGCVPCEPELLKTE